MTPLRIVFAGTPDFAATVLEQILAAGHIPVSVLTQPDRPQGRGRKLTPSPVKQLAERHGIPVLQPTTLNARRPDGEACLASLLSLPFDLLVVAAYGLMIPRPLLDHPRFGAINVHASLLPRWRGAAPVEYAIMAGDSVTGVTLMQMDAGLDTGPMIARAECDITETTTGTWLTDHLAQMGGALLVSTLPRLGHLTLEPQPDAFATHAPKLRAPDAVIDWTRPATAIHNQVRALTGRLSATTDQPGSTGSVRVRVLESEVLQDIDKAAEPGTILNWKSNDVVAVACGTGVLGLRTLQLSVGKGTALLAKAVRNGFPQLFVPGTVLGPGST